MPVSFKYILYLLLLVIGCCPPMAGHAATGEKPILMICSSEKRFFMGMSSCGL
jgi:hypothetical protein